MSTEEINKIVMADPAVISAAESLKTAKSAFDYATAAYNTAYANWQAKEQEIAGLASYKVNERKQLRVVADNFKNEYFSYKSIADTRSSEYNSAVKIYNDVLAFATDTATKIEEVTTAPQVAASNAQSTANIANVVKTQKDSIAEKLKANKKYIVWGLVAVVVVVVAVIVIKKYAK